MIWIKVLTFTLLFNMFCIVGIAGQWKEFKRETISFKNGNSYTISVSKRYDQDEMLECKVSVMQAGNTKPLREFLQKYAYEYGKFHILKSDAKAFIVSEINLGGAHCMNQYAAFFLEDNGAIKYEKEVEDYGYIITNKQKVIFDMMGDRIIYQVTKGGISKTRKKGKG